MRSGVPGEAALRFPRAGVTATSCLLVGLMLAALTATSCARGGRAGVGRDEVRVQVANVGPDQGSGAYYVLLADEAGKRTLPILVGENEALAISLQLKGVKTDRPLTYQLLRNVIEQTGNRVDRVVINDVRDQVYYAKIYLNRGKYSIDSRPSDAIALAMGANAPIYVADKLFAVSNLPGGGVTSAGKRSARGGRGGDRREIGSDAWRYRHGSREPARAVARGLQATNHTGKAKFLGHVDSTPWQRDASDHDHAASERVTRSLAGVENPSKNRDNLASVLNTLRPKLASFLNFSSASGETRVNLACRQPRTVLGDGV